MRNGTRLGLILIALAFLAASTAVSVHFIGMAKRQGEQRNVIPVLYRVSADA